MRLSLLVVASLLGVLLLSMAGPAGAYPVDSFFDVFLDPGIAGPPYPTAGAGVSVAHDGGVGFIEDASIRMGLKRADGGSPVDPYAITGTVWDAGGGLGVYGIDSFFDVFFVPSGEHLMLAPDSFFDIFMEVSSNVGAPGQLVTRHAEYAIDDWRRYADVVHVDSFFDIFLSVDFGYGQFDYHLHGACDTQVASFFDVWLELATPSAPDSFFDVWLEMSRGPVAEYTAPVIHLTLTGQFNEHPTGVQPATWGAVKRLYAR